MQHNDNSGNAYSDVFWLASVIESIGSLEFGKQNLRTLARMLKQIDRFLQYDRLMPSYNGVVTISCIHTLAKLAIRFSHALPTERVKQLLNQFKDRQKVQWQVRVAALKALLDIELQSKGLEAAVNLALQQVHGDLSFGVQSKIMKHVVRMASITEKGKCRIGGVTIARLLALLESSKAFHNVMLRHSIFSFLQVLAGRSASLYRSAEFLAKLAPNHVSQDKRFAKTKNLFKLRLRPTQSPAPPAPQSEPLKLRLILPSSSKDNADRAESESSGGKRFSIKLKLSKSSSAHEGAGDDTSQALEVSTGAVPMDHHVANSPLSVKEEVNLHEVIDSNLGFSQLESSRTQPLDNHPDESQILDTHNIHVGVEGDTQDTTAQGNEEMKYRDVEGTEELVHEDTEGGGSPRRSYHANTYPESDSRASTEQEPPFDLYGEDTQDGMGESRDDSRKALGVSRTMESDLQGYNSLSGMIDAENSTQDGGFEETESLRRVEKQSGDKKERKHDKKDKKDRKDKKKKKKHDKHNDPEYLEKKRKRKEEREQRHRQEGHKSSKEEKHRKEDSHEKVEEKPAFDAPMNDYSQSEGTKVENQGGNDIMKIKFKFKKPRTTTSDR